MLYQYNHSISAIILELIDFGIPDINSYMLLLWREFEIELNVYGGVLIFFRCGLFYLLLDLDFSIRFGEGHWPCENKGAAIYNIHQHRHIRSPSSSLSLSHTHAETHVYARRQKQEEFAPRHIERSKHWLWLYESLARFYTHSVHNQMCMYMRCVVYKYIQLNVFFFCVYQIDSGTEVNNVFRCKSAASVQRHHPHTHAIVIRVCLLVLLIVYE